MDEEWIERDPTDGKSCEPVCVEAAGELRRGCTFRAPTEPTSETASDEDKL